MKRAAVGALAGVVSLTMAATACAPTAPEVPVPQRLVLITVDTLRADHMSSFDYPIATTPFLDRLAAEGTLFTRAYAHSATTKPSHASMFTSLYPVQHRVQNNGLVLDEEFETMAELMAAAGYETAAFVSIDAPLGGNVRQGFEVWDQHRVNRDQEEGRKMYRAAGDTVDRALAWIDEVTAEGRDHFFLWLHVYDPHKPLQPPADVLEEVEGMIAAHGEQAYRDLLISRGIPVGDDQDAARNAVAAYDAEILYADRQLARLFSHLDASGLNDEALWIVTSDHGQGLGAHEWFGHSKQIYNAQLWVPLLFWQSESPVGIRISERVVQHVDLLPTISGVFGLTPNQIMPMQGRSLERYLVGGRPRQAGWFAFSERSLYENASSRRQQRGNYESGERYALQDIEYKYMLYSDGDDEFYDLRTDPYELVNMIDSPELAERRDQMRDVLAGLLENMPSERQAQTVSPEDIDRLRDLGYIQ